MRKTMIRFFTIADYEEEELWLRKQNRLGWKHVRMIPPCLYFFEACEPQDVIYRLDYKNSGQTEEYMQLVKDFGWEYFEQCMGWLYFRKPADTVESEGEDELFSDNASRVEMAGHIVRTRLVPIMIIFLCCLLPNLFLRREIICVASAISGTRRIAPFPALTASSISFRYMTVFPLEVTP